MMKRFMVIATLVITIMAVAVGCASTCGGSGGPQNVKAGGETKVRVQSSH